MDNIQNNAMKYTKFFVHSQFYQKSISIRCESHLASILLDIHTGIYRKFQKKYH